MLCPCRATPSQNTIKELDWRGLAVSRCDKASSFLLSGLGLPRIMHALRLEVLLITHRRQTSMEENQLRDL